jgi:hypothetical protein
VLVITLLFVVGLASSASAQLIAPAFVRQWTPPGTGNGGIAADPFGNVFVLSGASVSKYAHDGVELDGGWPIPSALAHGIATDPQGHVYLGNANMQLLEYTNGGGFLGSFKPTGFEGSVLAFDGAGDLYSNGIDANGGRAVNQYHFNGTKWKRVHSAPYPGSPNTGFYPPGFLGLTVDSDGSVYASAISTTNRYLLKFPPALGGAAGYLEDCPNATPPDCFGGFGLAFTQADVSAGGPQQPVVFSAGGFGDSNTSNFYRMGIYATNAGGPGTSRYLGSYDQHPVPGVPVTAVGSVAASPCRASVYELVSVFGGPGSTFSSYQVQQFDTHAAATSCATAFTAAVSGFAKKYVLTKPGGGTQPCIPCASVLKSGAIASSAGAEAAASKKKKEGGGVAITYKSSAAADTTFQFKRIGGRGPHKKLGGFIYAARAGKNAPRFSGVLRKKVALSPGTYKVTVSAGQKKKKFKLIVQS